MTTQAFAATWVAGLDDADPADRAPTGMATIVFVGDDPSVIRPMRHAALRWAGRWTVHFVESVPAALSLFRELGSVDVVVAHAHASGPPVSDLLDQVRRSSPQTARVLVTGAPDRELVLRLNAVAHRIVPLPLDIELLADLIENIRSASSTELRDPVRTLVGQVDRLPSPPSVFQRLTEIMESDDWSVNDLGAEIAQDAALTGEILKLVNSSFYGAVEQVRSVNRAITLVGVELIRFVVLGNKMFQSDGEFENWIDLDPLANRSKAVALGARALAIRDRAPLDTSAVAYLAGLVSEIGLLVLGRVPDISHAIAYPVNVSTYLGAERAIFGGDRFQVGAHLLTLWGFDQPVIDAVRQLSTEQVPLEEGLAWYLAASRHLVCDRGFDPHELASRAGTKPELDEAIRELVAAAESAAAGATAVA